MHGRRRVGAHALSPASLRLARGLPSVDEKLFISVMFCSPKDHSEARSDWTFNLRAMT